MPHQCVSCKTTYEDGSKTILSGCDCGSKFFFFFKNSEVRDKINNLSQEQIREIESDVNDLADLDTSDRPIVLDFESVKITEPGKFEIDLVNLLKGDSVVYKLEEGKYIIDVASTFQMHSKRTGKYYRPIKPVKKEKKKR